MSANLSHTPVTIHCAGSCSGNPGPGAWAAIILDGDAGRIVSGAEPHTTSQRMELSSALEALSAIPGRRHIAVYTANASLANCFLEGWWQRWERDNWTRPAKGRVANRDLWERLIAEARRHDVAWHHARGHGGDPLNARVARLAHEAVHGSGPRPYPDTVDEPDEATVLTQPTQACLQEETMPTSHQHHAPPSTSHHTPLRALLVKAGAGRYRIAHDHEGYPSIVPGQHGQLELLGRDEQLYVFSDHARTVLKLLATPGVHFKQATEAGVQMWIDGNDGECLRTVLRTIRGRVNPGNGSWGARAPLMSDSTRKCVGRVAKCST